MGHEVARGVYRHHRSLESKGTYMKKILILSLIFFTTDSFASGIASNAASAPCTNNTLETYSGNSNLQADWQPNTIDLRWYNGNTLMNVQSAANTCVYDGALTIPSTAPSRTGYTFAGWQVRPEMDFSTISVNNYISGYGKGLRNENDVNYCGYSGATYEESREGRSLCNELSEFNDLQSYEWKFQLVDGWLYGAAKCSGKSGNKYSSTWNINYKSDWTATYDELESATGDKVYCWCRATGFRQNNNNTLYGPSGNLMWVFADVIYSDTNSYFCPTICALRCGGSLARGWRDFRSALISQ